MKVFFAVLTVFVVLIFFIASCSKKPASGDPTSAIDGFARAVTIEEKRSFFTSETLKLLDEAEKKGFPNPSYFFYFLDNEAKWLETGRSVEGSAAEISIKIISHPVENLSGSEIFLILIKDRDGWKIDLADELRRAVSDRDERMVERYLKALRP